MIRDQCKQLVAAIQCADPDLVDAFARLEQWRSCHVRGGGSMRVRNPHRRAGEQDVRAAFITWRCFLTLSSPFLLFPPPSRPPLAVVAVAVVVLAASRPDAVITAAAGTLSLACSTASTQ